MKQVYDLTTSDLEGVGLWYFPMDGTEGGDEMSVRPVGPEMALPVAHQMIVRASFTTTTGERFPGYVYSAPADRVNELKPIMWMPDIVVSFWNGIIRPSSEYLAELQDRLGRDVWPIHFASESLRGLASLTGTLHGIYFTESASGSWVIKCVPPGSGRS